MKPHAIAIGYRTLAPDSVSFYSGLPQVSRTLLAYSKSSNNLFLRGAVKLKNHFLAVDLLVRLPIFGGFLHLN